MVAQISFALMNLLLKHKQTSHDKVFSSSHLGARSIFHIRLRFFGKKAMYLLQYKYTHCVFQGCKIGEAVLGLLFFNALHI